MNSRRDFLRKLGIGFGVFTISPQLLMALDKSEDVETTIKIDEKTTMESIRHSLDGLSAEDKELNERFFEYLKNNNVGFKWERVYSPVFEAKINDEYKPMMVKTRKMKTGFNQFWKEGFSEIESPSFSASTLSFHKYSEIEEYYIVLFALICNEIKGVLRKNSRFYIYHISFIPTWYNPENFEPRKGIMLCYATT